MSLDEDLESELSEMYLINILKNREDAVSTSELWAILKETCVALRFMVNNVEVPQFKININCLMLDPAGNVQIDVNQSTYSDSISNFNKDRSILINSIGETIMFIITNYSNIDSTENLYQFVKQLLKATPNDKHELYNIELHADRQLNGSSVEILSNDFVNFKKPEDMSSEFQDSFLSSEYSLNTDPNSDSDQSICLTKEDSTLSFKSECASIQSLNSDCESSLLSLNQLWNHCHDPIISSDQECLVLMHAILKKVSNNLLNDNDSKPCLCISTENILLNEKGKIFLNFSSNFCNQCIIEKSIINYCDIKYIKKIGNILYEVVRSDRRIAISNSILLMLQSMIDCQNLIINDVLYFCKSTADFENIETRPILIRLFDRWKHWYTIHLNYLDTLKYKFLYDISIIDFRKCLKKVSTKLPTPIHEIFHQHASWLKGLKYVTKLSKTLLHFNKKSTYYQELGSSRQLSAFQPYQSQTNCNSSLLPGKPSRVKYNTHFRPLILTSECDSVYRSQDNLLSPIDVLPKYSMRSQCCSMVKTKLQTNSQKLWQSVIHIPMDDTKSSLTRMAPKYQFSNESKTSSHQSLSIGKCSKPLKINSVIDIIQSNITEQSNLYDNFVTDRYILRIADFALSLETITENVFCEALQQRFSNVQWLKESLKLLYDTINNIDNDEGKQSNSLINEMAKLDGKPCQEETNNFINSENQNKIKLTKISNSLNNLNREEYPSDDCYSLKDLVTAKPFKMTKSASVINKKARRELISGIKSSLPRVRTLSESEEIYVNDIPEIQIQKHFENTSFYEIIHPSTLLCFSTTVAAMNSDQNPSLSSITIPNNIQDLMDKFFNVNQSIKLKFKELTKTMSLIGKCGETNEKKLKKQYHNDQVDLQQSLETLFISQMKFGDCIVEYQSVSMEPILEEIKSHCFNQSIRFSNDVKNLRNLQMVHPYALVACLFGKGAITSGLLYQFFLIYREFYTPLEFASTLSAIFLNLQAKFTNQHRQLTNVKFRLLFIIMCWMDGFYKIDFTDNLYSKLVNLVKKNLVPYLRNCDEIIEKVLTKAKNDTACPLLLKLVLSNDINDMKIGRLQKIDIQKAINSVEKIQNGKQKFYSWFNVNFDKLPKTIHKDNFSIFDFSSKDLAACFTLMEQNLFNNIHPCHLLLYIKSLSCTEESILQTIKLHKFTSNSPISENSQHKEILAMLRNSGKITHWAISEILRNTDFKFQGKIVKILLLTCIWCIELNNYATAISILEAIHSKTLKWAPFWNYVKPKTLKILKELDDMTNQFIRNVSNFTEHDKRYRSSFLTGSPFLPSLDAMIMNLKLALVGKSISKDGCLKWTKLKKISEILDKIRIYQQFKYISNSSEINDLKRKLSSRINHLTSMSLDILQSHSMLAQEA